MPAARIIQRTLLPLGGDMYLPTIQRSSALYDKAASGRFVVVDDHGKPSLPCKQLSNDFRERHSSGDKTGPTLDGGSLVRKRQSMLIVVVLTMPSTWMEGLLRVGWPSALR